MDAKPETTIADGDGGGGSANGGDGGDGGGDGGGGGGGGAASEAVHMHLEASVTADAGTYFYMDPYTTGGKATAALDIWSLGVVLYELCQFFATGMERAEALHAVRNGRGVSAEFASRQPTQAQLITQMLHASPAKRPSARAILESPLLPPRLEDELIKDALRVLSKPHSVRGSRAPGLLPALRLDRSLALALALALTPTLAPALSPHTLFLPLIRSTSSS